MSRSRRGIFIGMACGVLATGVVARARPAAIPPVLDPPLTTAELDSLSAYLSPSAAAPALDEYGAFLPAVASERPVDDPYSPSKEPAPEREWSVSAIVTGGARSIAVIDDVTIRSGAILSDGSRVVAIGIDHVILRDRNGTLRTLRLKAG